MRAETHACRLAVAQLGGQLGSLSSVASEQGWPLREALEQLSGAAGCLSGSMCPHALPTTPVEGGAKRPKHLAALVAEVLAQGGERAVRTLRTRARIVVVKNRQLRERFAVELWHASPTRAKRAERRSSREARDAGGRERATTRVGRAVERVKEFAGFGRTVRRDKPPRQPQAASSKGQQGRLPPITTASHVASRSAASLKSPANKTPKVPVRPPGARPMNGSSTRPTPSKGTGMFPPISGAQR